jgi:hypothetical protein
MSEKDVKQQAAKAAEFETEEFTFQDDEQRARYYKVLSEGYKTLWIDVEGKLEVAKNVHTHTIDSLEGSINYWRKMVESKELTIQQLKAVIKNRDEEIEELSNTLGLRNRSNPDLTIDDEPKSIFDQWKECRD